MRTLALTLTLALLTSCASLPAFIAAAVPIAERALDWISQFERHVTPLLDSVSEPTAAKVRDAIPIARAAAVTVRDCGRASGVRGGTVDCADALDELQREIETLWAVGRPLGVMPVSQPGLLGAPPSGVGVLGVPSACELVRGAEACAAQ